MCKQTNVPRFIDANANLPYTGYKSLQTNAGSRRKYFQIKAVVVNCVINYIFNILLQSMNSLNSFSLTLIKFLLSIILSQSCSDQRTKYTREYNALK